MITPHFYTIHDQHAMSGVKGGVNCPRVLLDNEREEDIQCSQTS